MHNIVHIRTYSVLAFVSLLFVSYYATASEPKQAASKPKMSLIPVSQTPSPDLRLTTVNYYDTTILVVNNDTPQDTEHVITDPTIASRVSNFFYSHGHVAAAASAIAGCIPFSLLFYSGDLALLAPASICAAASLTFGSGYCYTHRNETLCPKLPCRRRYRHHARQSRSCC